ncbi:methyltransferase domain-containing protein [Acidianus sulfidivorans JP7]|uniref:Protein methyltransferase n=1 Tax=Acidianus sulfidivorans JP7 TaxID=619593 RepID=A0A2U9IMB2_9CREN|nr:tRNA (adenine-N1)-methyltransferase [Acidianus sulfidivorans]AWR97157.1 methyltransferase domain-containing protein [Acidianus sulfidivorans JP7]
MPLKEGDPVTVWIDIKRVYLIKLTKGKRLDTDKGFLTHESIIGKEYGDTIPMSKGKALLLKPIPADIYSTFARPSQVLYPKDISYMIYISGIKPGDKVIEAGTGSGFLTISLAYAIGSNGKVISYDIRNDMQETAKFNANILNLLDRIEFKNKDIREGIDEKNIDAIFLDMPDPWNVVHHAYESLNPSSSLIAFVPTVNQIEKTYLAMKDQGFIDIHAEELMLREYQVKENATRPKNIGVMHTGFIIRGRKSIKGVSL